MLVFGVRVLRCAQEESADPYTVNRALAVAAAAMVCAAERLRDENAPVALLFVVGEEVSHDGAHAANEAFASGRVPRTKTNEQVLAELDALYALGYRGHIDFVDDNLIGEYRLRSDGDSKSIAFAASDPAVA